MDDLKQKTEIELNHRIDTPILEKKTSVQEITGLFKTVSVVPTYIPRSIFEQIVIYVSGSTKRLYIYDADGNTWVKLTGTSLVAGTGISVSGAEGNVTITNLNP